MNSRITSKGGNRFLRYLSLAMALGSALLQPALATAPATGTSLAEPFQVREFREVDRQFVAQALAEINDLAGSHFGQRVSGDPERDIPLLQRLLDERHIASGDLRALQAMGVALGELLRGQRELVWVRYVDDKGASRALQLKREPCFLYPVTAISRRASVGAPVDIRAIYERSLAHIDAYAKRQQELQLYR